MRAGRAGHDGRSRTRGDRSDRMLNAGACHSNASRAVVRAPCCGIPSRGKDSVNTAKGGVENAD